MDENRENLVENDPANFDDFYDRIGHLNGKLFFYYVIASYISFIGGIYALVPIYIQETPEFTGYFFFNLTTDFLMFF